MDAVSGDRGQALVLTAAILGVAAVAIVGVRGASERLLDDVRDQRAGEAAAAAAGAAVADLIVARAADLGRDMGRDEVALFVTEPAVQERARAAADGIARLHGRSEPAELRVLAIGLEVEVHVTLAGRAHVALLTARP
jgi:hypothetical protein